MVRTISAFQLRDAVAARAVSLSAENNPFSLDLRNITTESRFVLLAIDTTVVQGSLRAQRLIPVESFLLARWVRSLVLL